MNPLIGKLFHIYEFIVAFMKLNVRSNAKIIPVCGNVVHFGRGNIHFKKSSVKDFAKITERFRIKGQTPCPAPFGKAGI